MGTYDIPIMENGKVSNVVKVKKPRKKANRLPIETVRSEAFAVMNLIRGYNTAQRERILKQAIKISSL